MRQRLAVGGGGWRWTPRFGLLLEWDSAPSHPHHPHHPPSPPVPHPLSPQRYNYPERIATAVDDYVQRSRQRGGGKDGAGGGGGPPGKQQQQNGGDGVGWGCPRVRYVFICLSISRALPWRRRRRRWFWERLLASSGGGGGDVGVGGNAWWRMGDVRLPLVAGPEARRRTSDLGPRNSGRSAGRCDAMRRDATRRNSMRCNVV